MNFLTKALVLSLFSFIAFACSPTTIGGDQNEEGGCLNDSACGDFQRCDIPTGICLCASDDACDGQEFCNDIGRCQAIVGCVDNSDCGGPQDPSNICDTNTGECITLSAQSVQCTLSNHCPFGTYCANNQCIQGCETNGDCKLGDPCLNGQCDPSPGACNENAFCDFGQLCDVATSRCVDHPERSGLCQPCGQGNPCDFGASCLIDPSVPPDPCTDNSTCSQYPGASCQQAPLACETNADCGAGGNCGNLGVCTCPGLFGGEGVCPATATCDSLGGICNSGFCGRNFCGTSQCNDDCPRGYNCFVVSTVTNIRCTLGDGTCTDGRTCRVGGENNVAGSCSCIADSDCPDNLTCVNPGANGSCVSGSTCAPQPGLLCEDVR